MAVWKEPATDPSKNSKRGRLSLVIKTGAHGKYYQTLQYNKNFDVLQTVFENGEVEKTYSLSEVRANTEENFRYWE
jgi:hypothetical protein